MAEAHGYVADVVSRLIDVFEASGEVYALGGAIALAAWSEPRATADVDLVVWPSDGVERTIDLVEQAGVVLERDTARADAESRGLFVGQAGSVRVDVFVPSIAFYEEAAKKRVRTSILGRGTWVHSAEVLAVFKMLFFRPKDLVDIERMLRVQGAAFDRAFVRESLMDLLGEDPRITKWDEICARA